MNDKIGERQRWVWLAAAVSAAAAILLCRLNWIWVLLGGSGVTLYYLYIEKRLGTDGLAERMIGLPGKIFAVIMIFWIVLLMGYCACLADRAFPMVDGFPGLGWVLLALSAWGSRKGARACAGCSGILSLFLVALYGVIAMFSAPDVELKYLRLEGQWTQVITASVVFLLPLGVWMLPVRQRKGSARWWVLLLPVLAAALSAVTAGVLSPELAQSVQVPLYELSRSVSVLGVVERIEPLLSAAMTMGLFCLLSSLSCAAQVLADRIEPWKWSGSVCCLAAAGAMYLARQLPGGVWVVGNLLIFLVFPAVLVTFKKR